MSATPYDLVQDDKILDLQTKQEIVEGILLDATEPPAGAAGWSFPIVGQAWSSAMWQQMMKGFGSGVLDFGGYPFYRSTVNDISGTVTIKPEDNDAHGRPVPAQAIIDGYFFRLDEPVALTIPGVSVSTRVSIALEYDPQREKDALGPIRLDVFMGNLNRTQGRKYVVLWEGVRQPSTVVSQIQWVQKRHRVSPTIHVADEDHLPHPLRDGLMYGTIARVGTGAGMREVMLAGTGQNMSWRSTEPEWKNLNLTSSFKSKWATARYRVWPTTIELQGSVERTNGAALPYTGGARTLATIPELSRNNRLQLFPAAAYDARRARIEVNPAEGATALQYLVSDPNVKWIGFDGIRIQLT